MPLTEKMEDIAKKNLNRDHEKERKKEKRG